MRRMLDPKEAGGLPSTIEFDKDGNRKVKKNLEADGKLTLKSLVSASNPDGDITKELGGGGKTIHLYAVELTSSPDCKFYYIASSANDYGESASATNFGTNQTYADLRKIGKTYAASGYGYKDNQMCQVFELFILDSTEYPFQIYLFNPATKKTEQLIKGQMLATILKIS